MKARNPDASLTLPRRSATSPLYQRVKDAIIGQVLSGCWQGGQRLPSENALVRELGISRMTVHRALRELTAEGWLQRRQGAGTYVAEPKPQSAVMEISSVRQEIEGRGHRHDAEVRVLRRQTARALEAGMLGLETGDQVFHSLILHRENGVPLQLENRFVNPAIAPNYLKQDFTRTTPYDYLVEVAPHFEAEHVILAVMPTERVRKLLEMNEGEPCLLLRRRTWVETCGVTWVELYHPGDRYRLSSRFDGRRRGES
jgi:GntR family histidine utilization transcriptional repressor